MVVPPRVVDAVAPHVRITSAKRVSGGCISPAARVETDNGSRFLKWSGDHRPSGMFHAEAHALRTIAETATVRVPEVEAVSGEFLLMEWLEPGEPGRDAWTQLGAALATMHRTRSDRFGWKEPNFIGSLPQSNRPHANWPEFWRTERIEPQLKRAVNAGSFTSTQRHALSKHLTTLDDLLAIGDAEGASLLHGDLWNGNAHATAGGVALIDPAAYYGHREVDLAMAALFGGFPSDFYEAYQSAWPLAAGSDQRRAAYQLYYLLVHVNLFGAGYVASVMESVSRTRM